MPISVIGSFTPFNLSTGNTGSITGITVPADAEAMIAGFSGYPDDNSASYFSGGAVNIGGSAFTLVAGDGDSNAMEGALGYRILPPTGTQTLAWDWAGSATITGFPGVCFYGFIKGIDTASPIRDSYGHNQTAIPISTPSLLAQTGDLIISWGFQFDDGTDSTSNWTNATGTDLTHNVNVDGSIGQTSPTGNIVITYNSSRSGDGGICSLVFKPASGGGGSSIIPIEMYLKQLARRRKVCF